MMNTSEYVMDVFVFYDLRVKVFNATFSNISVISWQSVLLVQETAILFDKEHGGH
jgi:hypothetical protein